jgi:chaperonin GroES
MLKYQPLHGRILVKVDLPEEMTKGGIIIPDNAKEKPLTATVHAVAKGRFIGKHFIPLQIEPGMKVLLQKYAGDEIVLDGEQYLSVHEDHVLGICL